MNQNNEYQQAKGDDVAIGRRGRLTDSKWALEVETALAGLVDKIVPGLDTGDLLADAVTASKALDHAHSSGVSGQLPRIVAGRLPTLNTDEYPGLGAWWINLRNAQSRDEVVARVDGSTVEDVRERAVAFAEAIAIATRGTGPDSDRGES